MDNEIIKNLREALESSPENIPLRLLLAKNLLQINNTDEAESEYIKVLAIDARNDKAKWGLANTYFRKEEYTTANVILEELLEVNANDVQALVLYSKSLLREDAMEDAIHNYKKVLEIDPLYRDEELDQLRNSEYENDKELNQDEVVENLFIENPNIDFKDVGGMDSVKKEIEMKIIQPLKHPDLYKAYGKKIGGGILLYGPPGCGKTHIAKATAGQVNARFISVSLSDVLDMWMGNSEKNLHNIFENARKNTPCVLFFDEIDALGASRSDMKQSSGRHLINQFLQELDGIEHSNEGVLVLGATNTPWHLDTAFRRPGRFDRIIFVPPPDIQARESILKLKLKGKPTENIDYSKLSKKTPDFSGADIEALIDIAIEEKLNASFKDGIPKPLQTRDFIIACKKHKPTTKEWFSTAKNFALYANDSGLYDDILSYLKIKK